MRMLYCHYAEYERSKQKTMYKYLDLLKVDRNRIRSQTMIQVNCDALFKLQEIDYKIDHLIDVSGDISDSKETYSEEKMTVYGKKFDTLLDSHTAHLEKIRNKKNLY